MEAGDIIEFPRSVYKHYGLFIGEDQYIHIKKREGEFYVEEGEISLKDLLTLTRVANEMDDTWTPLKPHEIVARARSKQFPYVQNNEDSLAVGMGSRNVGPMTVSALNWKVSKEQSDTRKGFVDEVELVGAKYGPVNAKLGVGISTTVHAGDGSIGGQVLGTGFSLGRETKISILGSSVGFKFW